MRTAFLRYALLGAFASAALAGDGAIDKGKSTLTVQFRQMNVPVDAAFKRFEGTVGYDPAKPADAKARIDIDMGSFDIGDEDYNAEVRKKEWFDSAAFPKASFQASGLAPVAGGRFQASGTLSLKGKSLSLSVPVAISSTGGVTSFDGTVPISRSAFNIGDAEWKDTVADEVQIRFHIVVPAAH